MVGESTGSVIPQCVSRGDYSSGVSVSGARQKRFPAKSEAVVDDSTFWDRARRIGVRQFVFVGDAGVGPSDDQHRASRDDTWL